MEMFNPAHPGELLREYLPAAMTVAEAAQRLKVTRQALSAVLNGRAGISADMDLRLAAALGTTPGFWLRLQAQHAYGRLKINPVRPFGASRALLKFCSKVPSSDLRTLTAAP